MFFGAITSETHSGLEALPGDPESARGGVTGRRILAVLKETLPTMIIRPGMYFAHDNGPTFKARIVQNWLREFAAEHALTVVTWPAYSPDLNPIENCWDVLKKALEKQHPELKFMKNNKASANLLEVYAFAIWNEIRIGVFFNCVRSMPKRLQDLRGARGWYIRY
jgi:transposase